MTEQEKNNNEAAAEISIGLDAPAVLAENLDIGATVDTAANTPTKETAKPRAVKGKAKRQVSHGRVYIKATYNNTIITFTDQNGNVLAWSSAGKVGFKGPKKSTPYAASMIVKDAADSVSKYGLKEVNAFVCGVGFGRDSAIRSLNANGINVLAIKDITPIPHNGCRPPRPRRV